MLYFFYLRGLELSLTDFDRLVAMLYAANSILCVLLSGDFWQLPGPPKDAVRIDSGPAFSRKIIFLS